jgi:hypothetical protein
LFHVVLIVAPSKGKGVNGGSIKDKITLWDRQER